MFGKCSTDVVQIESLNISVYISKCVENVSSYAKNKLQMGSSINISVDVAKCEENVHKFTQFTDFLSVTKNDLS